MSSTLFLPASVALVLSILYTLNGAFVTRQLQTGTVHFPKDNNKPFATNSSRSSPLTKSIERPANLGPFRGQRGNYSTSNQGAKNTQKIEDDSFGRKPGLQSPETPVFDRVNSEMKEVPKGVLTNPQSTEKEKVFNRRVTSWFTDVGDTKKDIPLNSESTFTQPSDFLKQDLDAREQYIKSKQYRDFMDPLPSNQKKSSIMKITEDSVRKFNKKFSESGDETASYRSIGVDDDPGTALTPDKTFASGLNSTFKEEKTSASGSGTTVMRDETFSPGPGIPLMKDEMFVSGPSTIVKHHVTFASGSEKTTPEKIEGSRTAWTSEKAFTSGPSTFPSTRGDHDSGSGSRSLSSLNSNSSKTPERGDSPQESSAGSTVRIDDIDRRTLRSPLRDTSLMTTSTIVSLNSTNIANWTKNTETQKYNNPEIKRHVLNIKALGIYVKNYLQFPHFEVSGFDVIIRSRESPINRPQSVTLSTEFPSFPQNTTLRIKSPPESSQYSRQSSTQL
ncbi:hypothetical protein FO519_006346 [Halicephalobus sp. NKZ332]|nr:hypothetical protein FO519_006346 [Halicephalobus sp. NKZ332]